MKKHMKKIIFALLAAGAICLSCAKELHENAAELTPQQQTLMTKLVGGTQGELIPGSLLVRLEDEAVSAVGSNGSGVFDGIEGLKISPALPVQPKNMEVARKYGLHQWFTVEFDPQLRLEAMAERLAAAPQVKSLQYSRHLEPVTGGDPMPFDMTVLTRSEDAVPPKDAGLFDDPFFSWQWNLDNDGSIAKGAVEGADVGVRDAWRLTGGDPSVVVAVFDCAVAHRHEDLADAVWKNEAEINGTSGKDDDGNGFIDDLYGFNFVNCFAINEEYIDGALDGKATAVIKGYPINSTAGVGHGTHVAGIIGATNNNGKGISSIAGGTGQGDGVRLMTCQIFQGSSYCTDAQSAAAYIYAADNGACIAQCSYGNQFMIRDDDTYINGGELEDGTEVSPSPLENAALNYFLDPANSNHESLRGNIAVFASGNHQNPHSIYPGALPYVLSVTAFGCDFLPGGYSNYGPGCKISAPGGEWKGVVGDYSGMILSTGLSCSIDGGFHGIEVGGGESKNYVYMQGTSMACPHVSGVLALGISYAKKLGKTFTREEMTSMLLTSVNDLDSHNKGGSRNFFNPFSSIPVTVDMNAYKGNMGTGAVDAWKFLMAIEGTPSVMVKAGEKTAVDLSQCLGGSVMNMKYELSIDEQTKASLGLTEDPVIKNGMLELTCTKVGAGKVTFRSAVGKDTTMENGIGEMEFSRELSIVSRPYAASNGGWF